MGGEDLVTLLIFGAFILWSITASSRKKQRRAPPQRPPLQRSLPPSQSEFLGRSSGVEGRQPGDLASELYDLLRGQLPSERPPVVSVPAEPPTVSVSPPPPPMPAPSEAVSLESLDPDWDEAQAEFHEKYVEHARPASAGPKQGVVTRLTPHTAREAVIWMTIFDRPKGWW